MTKELITFENTGDTYIKIMADEGYSLFNTALNCSLGYETWIGPNWVDENGNRRQTPIPATADDIIEIPDTTNNESES